MVFANYYWKHLSRHFIRQKLLYFIVKKWLNEQFYISTHIYYISKWIILNILFILLSLIIYYLNEFDDLYLNEACHLFC